MKFISVLIPVYNCENTLARCLDSLLYQDYTQFEIVIVNDGSTDKTEDLILEYKEQYPALFKIIKQENQGVSVSRNTALKHASGELIFFIDGDDYLEIDALSTMAEQFNNPEIDCVIAGHDLVYPKITVKNHVLKNKIVDNQEALKLLLKDWQVRNYCWGKLFKKELFNGLEFKGNCFEDVRLIHQVLNKAHKISILSSILYHYSLEQDTTLTSNMDQKKFEDWMIASVDQRDEILKNHPSLKKTAKEMIVRNAFISASRVVFNKNSSSHDRKWALTALKESIKINDSSENLRKVLKTRE